MMPILCHINQVTAAGNEKISIFFSLKNCGNMLTVVLNHIVLSWYENMIKSSRALKSRNENL